MGTKRWGAGVAVMGKRLWVIGGMNGAERGALPTLEVYDPGLLLCASVSVFAPVPVCMSVGLQDLDVHEHDLTRCSILW
jgi:hypothetical protein